MLLTGYQSFKKIYFNLSLFSFENDPLQNRFHHPLLLLLALSVYLLADFGFWLIWSPFSSSFLVAPQYPEHKVSLLWQRVGSTFSTALRYFPHGSPCEIHLPSFLLESCVLVGLQLAVIVWEFVVEDGDGHAIQDYPKSNAEESKQAPKVSFWTHISITHCRDADLEANQHTACQLRRNTGTDMFTDQGQC